MEWKPLANIWTKNITFFPQIPEFSSRKIEQLVYILGNIVSDAISFHTAHPRGINTMSLTTNRPTRKLTKMFHNQIVWKQYLLGVLSCISLVTMRVNPVHSSWDGVGGEVCLSALCSQRLLCVVWDFITARGALRRSRGLEELRLPSVI